MDQQQDINSKLLSQQNGNNKYDQENQNQSYINNKNGSKNESLQSSTRLGVAGNINNPAGGGIMHQAYTVSVDMGLTLCGNAHSYQFKTMVIMSLNCLVAAFINMGFIYFFTNPDISCYPENGLKTDAVSCTSEQACAKGMRYFYPNPDTNKSLTFKFDLICEEDSYEGISGALLLLGGCIGSLYYADTTEKQGRLRVMKESVWIMAISAFVASFSFNIYMFIGCMVFFGIGYRAYFNACIIYLTETSSNTLRQLAPNILSIGWALGQIVIALLAMINDEWYFITFIYTAVPIVVLMTFTRFQVESPRYLTIKKRFIEAKQALVAISKVNVRPLPENFRLQEELQQNQFKENLDKILGINNNIKDQQQQQQQEKQDQGFIQGKMHSFKALFEYKSLRLRSVIITYLWCLLSFSYFVSAFALEHFAGSIHYNLMGMGLGELLAYLYSGYISLRFPRKDIIRNILFAAGVIHLAFFLFLIKTDQNNSFIQILTFCSIITLRLAISTGNCIFNVYIAEVYPTSIRHYAFGYFGFCTKFVAIFAPPFVQVCEAFGLNPFIPLSIFFFLGIPLLTKLRETYQQPLKEQVEEEESVFLQNDIPLIPIKNHHFNH